jgi:hypothetical protein
MTFRHGHAPFRGASKTYVVWNGILTRCTNPHSVAFRLYGARGITVCERWLDFANFLADMGERPAGKTIDRYPDQRGNYEPGNCRWATWMEQQRNRTNNRRIEARGLNLTLAEWAERTGCNESVLRQRIDLLGWTVERALSQPLKEAAVVKVGEIAKTTKQWSIELGAQEDLVYLRIKRGWDPIEAATTPVRKGNYRRANPRAEIDPMQAQQASLIDNVPLLQTSATSDPF